MQPRWLPLNGKILIKLDPKEETTKGGILLPEQAQEHPNSGVCLSAGVHLKDNCFCGGGQHVQEKQRVYFPAHAIHPFKEDLIFVNEKEIWCVENPEPQ